MRRKTIYEWRFEQTEDGNVVDVCHNESNSLNGLLMGELEDYGSNNRDLNPIGKFVWSRGLGMRKRVLHTKTISICNWLTESFSLIYQINIFLMKYPSVLKHR